MTDIKNLVVENCVDDTEKSLDSKSRYSDLRFVHALKQKLYKAKQDGAYLMELFEGPIYESVVKVVISKSGWDEKSGSIVAQRRPRRRTKKNYKQFLGNSTLGSDMHDIIQSEEELVDAED